MFSWLFLLGDLLYNLLFVRLLRERFVVASRIKFPFILLAVIGYGTEQGKLQIILCGVH